MSAELYNPSIDDEDGQEIYSTLIEQVTNQLMERFGEKPDLHSSSDYCEECPDESVEFIYFFEPDIQIVDDFIKELNNISEKIS